MTTKDEIFEKLYNQSIIILNQQNIEIPPILNFELLKIFLITNQIKSLDEFKQTHFYKECNQYENKLDETSKRKMELLMDAMIELIN